MQPKPSRSEQLSIKRPNLTITDPAVLRYSAAKMQSWSTTRHLPSFSCTASNREKASFEKQLLLFWSVLQEERLKSPSYLQRVLSFLIVSRGYTQWTQCKLIEIGRNNSAGFRFSSSAYLVPIIETIPQTVNAGNLDPIVSCLQRVFLWSFHRRRGYQSTDRDYWTWKLAEDLAFHRRK